MMRALLAFFLLLLSASLAWADVRKPPPPPPPPPPGAFDPAPVVAGIALAAAFGLAGVWLARRTWSTGLALDSNASNQ
jgi:hypothetical protein